MFIDRRTSRFAAALSATAGFVDAVGWLTSGGLFVSFMSGNVTKLGLGLAGHLDNAVVGLSRPSPSPQGGERGPGGAWPLAAPAGRLLQRF
jgi:hypothetical protein